MGQTGHLGGQLLLGGESVRQPQRGRLHRDRSRQGQIQDGQVQSSYPPNLRAYQIQAGEEGTHRHNQLQIEEILHHFQEPAVDHIQVRGGDKDFVGAQQAGLSLVLVAVFAASVVSVASVASVVFEVRYPHILVCSSEEEVLMLCES